MKHILAILFLEKDSKIEKSTGKLKNLSSLWSLNNHKLYTTSCQMLSIQNVITQNAVQKCSGCTKGKTLFSYHAVGYVLIVDSSQKTISHNETFSNVGISKVNYYCFDPDSPSSNVHRFSLTSGISRWSG
jgi:hypothetical protein